MSERTLDLFEMMPKVELHLHLDGALPPATVIELAQRNHLDELLPGQTEEEIVKWFVFRDFYHFVEVKRFIKKLLRSAEDFDTAVYAMGRELAAQNIRYAEVTVTPYSFVDVLHPQLTIEALLEGLESGRQRVRREHDIEIRWVFDIPRNRAFSDYHKGGEFVPEAAERTCNYAVLGQDYGVIALGLGGSEVNAPPEPFAEVFQRAKAHGLKSLPHAGESEGPASVSGAVHALQADRIGHGVRAVEDARLVDMLVERQIPLEVSVTSNVNLNFYPDVKAHPLPTLDKAGALITINTDDPHLFGTNLNREYRLLRDVFGYSNSDVARLARNAFTACYAEPSLKSRLLEEFDGWATDSLQSGT